MRIEEKIGMMLRGTGKTLSVAESCTGGQISHLLTMVSGSSNYYLGSVTSYAVAVKEKVLNVPDEIIERCGVVSSEVAAAMAEGVRKLTGSTYAISTTGLAEGGDCNYPEGTVWIAVASEQQTWTRMYQCNLGRKGNIRRFAEVALSTFFNLCLSSGSSKMI